ncbi:unnamed protein product [Symbiodinium sp. CCMP2592]|nr:unnamed protein product [Symbiodinium sp. CCMP2592]
MVAAGPADPISGLTLDAADILLLVSLLAITLVVNNVIQKQSWPIPEAISTILVGIGLGAVAAAFPEAFLLLEGAKVLVFAAFPARVRVVPADL